MGFWLVITFFNLSLFGADKDDFRDYPSLKGAQLGQRIYLDIEEDHTKELTLLPGERIPVAEIGRDDEVKILGYNTFPIGKNKIPTLFLQVEWTNPSSKVGQTPKLTGWISADRASTRRYPPVFNRKLKYTRQYCEAPTQTNFKNLKQICDVQNNHVQISKDVEQISESIKGLIGRCGLQGKKDLSPPYYDKYILPQFENVTWPTKPMWKDSDKVPPTVPVTKKDLIAIDAMARTLYGEMAQCHKFGPQYAIALAGILSKRATYCHTMKHMGRVDLCERDFIQSEHSNKKDFLAQVATEPKQFDTWRSDQNYKHSVCPPSNPDKNFYTGGRPWDEQLEIWNDMVKIAVEAVIYPSHFNAQRLPGFNYYFYSSLPAKIDNFLMTPGTPLVAGRPLENPKCMQTYEDQPDLSPLKNMEADAALDKQLKDRKAMKKQQKTEP